MRVELCCLSYETWVSSAWHDLLLSWLYLLQVCIHQTWRAWSSFIVRFKILRLLAVQANIYSLSESQKRLVLLNKFIELALRFLKINIWVASILLLEYSCQPTSWIPLRGLSLSICFSLVRSNLSLLKVIFHLLLRLAKGVLILLLSKRDVKCWLRSNCQFLTLLKLPHTVLKAFSLRLSLLEHVDKIFVSFFEDLFSDWI